MKKIFSAGIKKAVIAGGFCLLFSSLSQAQNWTATALHENATGLAYTDSISPYLCSSPEIFDAFSDSVSSLSRMLTIHEYSIENALKSMKIFEEGSEENYKLAHIYIERIAIGLKSLAKEYQGFIETAYKIIDVQEALDKSDKFEQNSNEMLELFKVYLAKSREIKNYRDGGLWQNYFVAAREFLEHGKRLISVYKANYKIFNEISSICN
ncbi:hypothetical protein [Endozoicomonas sp. OPT23]|uniref:hypothetical protein n=1 Tax=Endozoicomonas sp. OPT23 TaxID=2072845 RepID=UPI00129AC639|nr:hypothetical protein [Endozoicomonas sp. OPT23]